MGSPAIVMTVRRTICFGTRMVARIVSAKILDQLDLAQRRWPEIRDRKLLLLRLLKAGGEAIEREARDRAQAVEETAGVLSGVYEPGELERLREDWPE
jgi:hypothetical protein